MERVGRRVRVELLCLGHVGGLGAAVMRLLGALGVFREPLAGLEPQLAHVEGTLEEIALDAGASLTGERLDRLVADARAPRPPIREGAYQHLHPDPYRPDMAAAIPPP